MYLTWFGVTSAQKEKSCVIAIRALELGEAVLAHLLTFVIRARQRLLQMDDCLAPPAPPRRRRQSRHTGGATWVDVRCGCERLRHDLKNPSTLRDAQSKRNASGGDENGRGGTSSTDQVFPQFHTYANRLAPLRN